MIELSSTKLYVIWQYTPITAINRERYIIILYKIFNLLYISPLLPFNSVKISPSVGAPELMMIIVPKDTTIRSIQ